VFEKTNLKKKSPNDYPDIRKSGILAKMKNKNQGENGESASDPAQVSSKWFLQSTLKDHFIHHVKMDGVTSFSNLCCLIQNKNAAPDLSNPGAPNDSADG